MIDERAITHYFDDDHELFRRFVAQFVAQTPGLLKRTESFIFKNQFEDAGTALHTLKGHLRYLGLDRLADKVKRLEGIANKGSDNKVLLLGWQEFIQVFAPVYRYLEKY